MPKLNPKIVQGLGWLAGALILILLIVGAFYFFFREKGVDPAPSDFGTSGTIPGTTPPGETPGEGDDTPTEITLKPQLFQIHDRPVLSFVTFDRAGKSLVRFMEAGTGHVYEHDASTGKKVRISNTSIPQISTVVWSQNGNTLALQYAEGGTVKTAVGELATSSEEGSFKKITFLPEGITAVAVSPDGESVFYMSNTQTGSSGRVVRKDGSSSRVVFESAFSDWLVAWPNQKVIAITSRVSESGGIAYRVDPSAATSQLVRVTQGFFSGVLYNPAATVYLFAPGWARGVTHHNIARRASYGVASINTIPDKCSWLATSTPKMICGSSMGTDSELIANPEGWLRGDFVSTDTLLYVDYVNGIWASLLTIEGAGDRQFDVAQIGTSPSFFTITFKDKTTGTLWGAFVPEPLRKL